MGKLIILTRTLINEWITLFNHGTLSSIVLKKIKFNV